MIQNKKVVLVVCRGNIARSPVAEFFLNSEIKKRFLDKDMIAISRGIQGTLVDPQPVKFSNISSYSALFAEAKPAIDKLKIDISAHVSKPITSEDTEIADIILAVDKRTKKSISDLFPDLSEKVYLLAELVGCDDDFADPENLSGTEKHFKVFQEINETIVKGFPKLMDLLK